MYTLNMLAIAMELADEDPSYEDIASKFWEHFLYIANAMSDRGGALGLWDETDGFFYDVLHTTSGARIPLKVQSMVGLIPLFAVETLEPRRGRAIRRLPATDGVVHREPSGSDREHRLDGGAGPGRSSAAVDRGRRSAAPHPQRDARRAASSSHRTASGRSRAITRSIHASCTSTANSISSTTSRRNRRHGLFGGNSNWRGPIWFPVNYLLIEALQKFHYYYGDDVHRRVPDRLGHRW